MYTPTDVLTVCTFVNKQLNNAFKACINQQVATGATCTYQHEPTTSRGKAASNWSYLSPGTHLTALTANMIADVHANHLLPL